MFQFLVDALSLDFFVWDQLLNSLQSYSGSSLCWLNGGLDLALSGVAMKLG